MKLIIMLGLIIIPIMSYAQEVVNVRYGDHDTFSRVVFDWTEMVTYTQRLTNDELEITFDRSSTPYWNQLDVEPLNFLSDPNYRIEGGNLVVTFKVTQPGRLKHFRYGTKIAFDLIVSHDNAQAEEEIIPANLPSSAPVETAVIDQNAPEVSSSAETGYKPSPREGNFALQVTRRQDSLRLSYPWERTMRAAAFVRHNKLWVVFEGKEDVDQKGLDPFIGQRIISARQLDHPTMTILTYDVAPGQNVKVQKIGTVWHLDLKNSLAVPAILIPTSHQRVEEGTGENFFYSVENAGSILVIQDPVIGDDLAIVPVMESSQGSLKAQKFTEFQSLATAQGIAVQLIADDLNVVKYRNGISVGSKEGLALSRSQFSSQLGFAPIGEGESSDAKLVDFAKWSQGPLEDEDYHANKHELLYLVSNSTDANRSELRWKLARFYLANGRKREAFGVLNVMLEDEPKLIESPEFRTVLAVTNILMNRYKEGAKLLVHKELVAEQDVFLWSAVANGALGNHKLAYDNYQKGSDTLSLQDPSNQIRFLFAAIRSAYQVGDKDFVALGLSLLKTKALNAAQLTEAYYWQAMLDRDNGDTLKAEETLRGLVKAGVRQTAAWAKLDLINMDFQNKTIDAVEAVDQLEKLRFAWRGDDFELELLSRLGDLYVEQKDFNTGLQTLKLAVTFFDESKKTDELTKQMSQIYSELFLNGGSEVMDPVKAVALYSEFRELIPLGKDGDNMTRRLADRLVTLDLLEEAADLLDHQVKFRLQGVAQSVVASRLAMIYLLDAKPEDALGILRATRGSQIPDDIKDRRTMIEARTLIELGRFEEAEVLIEKFYNKEAEDLRADIYWKSEDWNKYIAHGNRMLGNRHLDDAELKPDERLAVLRLSVAYVINDDKVGIKDLRNKYKAQMDDGLYGDTFEVITAEKQLTDQNVRRLTKSIASVSKLESFMESYKSEFSNNIAQN